MTDLKNKRGPYRNGKNQENSRSNMWIPAG